MASELSTTESNDANAGRPEAPTSVAVDIPAVPHGFHCVVSLLFYGKINRTCTLKDGNDEVIALHNSRNNLNKTMFVGIDDGDGPCKLELTGVTMPEPWTPLADSRMTPMGHPVSTKVYSYTAEGMLDEKVLITIVVQAGVLPDIFQKNRVVIG